LFFMDETVRRTRHVAIVSSKVPDRCRGWEFKSPLRHKISTGHSVIRPRKRVAWRHGGGTPPGRYA
jgi:hypothetical protein